MKNYDKENYQRFKRDIVGTIGESNFLLVENIAKKFNTAYNATGVLTLEDLIQEGVIGLLNAMDKVDMSKINLDDESKKEILLKAFYSKRIKGCIRRAINTHMSSIKIPEYQLDKLRNNPDDNEELVRDMFNAKFLSIDTPIDGNGNTFADVIEDFVDEDVCGEQTDVLTDLMDNILTKKESIVIKHSFGIGTEKISAKEIGDLLGLKGKFKQVYISELKKKALTKLKESLDFYKIIYFFK